MEVILQRVQASRSQVSTGFEGFLKASRVFAPEIHISWSLKKERACIEKPIRRAAGDAPAQSSQKTSISRFPG